MDARPALSIGRRGLLAGLAGGALAVTVGCDNSDRAATPPKGSRRIRYGNDDPAQRGDLALPDGTPKGLVVLVHGGFWFAQYGADLMEPLAKDLNARGYATWNLEYRRIGDISSYADVLGDVAAGFDKVPSLGVKGPVTVIGHSAGGHLAVWAASRSDKTVGGAPKFLADTTISLSGVLDLKAAMSENLGGGAAQTLMGDASEDQITYADPIQLVPAHGSVACVHAKDDQNVPLSQSTDYVNADLDAGGAAGLFEVPGDHFALIDPTTAAWARTLKLLGS